eukprot:jgi/Ulvmu1/8077/UM004_0314.1
MTENGRYLRPVEEVTNTLFVGNAGPAVGLPAATVERMCVHLSPSRVEVPDPTKSFIFISFGTEELATAAKELLSQPGITGRPLTVKYAKRHPRFRDAPDTTNPALPLFTTAAELDIPGLQMIPNFVTEEEEAFLLQSVEHFDWRLLAKRSVLHFGYAFEYLTRSVSTQGCSGPIPASYGDLIKRMEALADVPHLDQLTVNRYPAGVGLSPHVDAHSAFTGSVLSLSLGSTAVMDFRRDDVRKCLFLPRRSLVVMSGECRYAWEHYIPHRKADVVNGEAIPRAAFRTSFTFRQARGFPCDCSYPVMCDSQESSLPPTRKLQLLQAEGRAPFADDAATRPDAPPQPPARGNMSGNAMPAGEAPQSPVWNQQQAGHSGEGARERAQHGDGIGAELRAAGGLAEGEEGAEDAQLRQLEAEHVHRVYDAIAPHFSATRFAIWPAVRRFIEELPAGAIVADVGCGNGKYLGVRDDVAVLASDPCRGLVHAASQRLRSGAGAISSMLRGADVLLADGMGLPYRRSSCDGVLCIAVLHHISSRARRVRFLEGLRDVLRAGGRAIVTVWATQQENPGKTVDRWTPMQPGAATGVATGVAGDDNEKSACGVAYASTREACDAGEGGQGAGQGAGSNYFVPWHLPFHRAEAHVAAIRARERGGGAASAPEEAAAGAGGGEGDAGPAVGEVDERKGTVVFKRYYHLFEAGEMEELAAQVDGVAVLDCFYDASNWVIVFERLS